MTVLKDIYFSHHFETEIGSRSYLEFINCYYKNTVLLCLWYIGQSFAEH